MPRLKTLPPRFQRADPPKHGWADPRRGSSTARGYGAAWQVKRRQTLEEQGGLCQPCLRRGHVTPGCRTVDHIVPKAQGGGDEGANRQCICDDCHKAKTAAEARGRVWDESMPGR